ncbi:CLUMA_CG011763, isoform A [Clunio marinus]|uniref:CLUMA_CG011763, isoform A n=1 Tax=Clunio marinus TaxID=568069 RepID=A0A1J1IFU2_9DIPT|nr:CLUMA_CG011763, isoform A [Clunio marinus]
MNSEKGINASICPTIATPELLLQLLLAATLTLNLLSTCAIIQVYIKTCKLCKDLSNQSYIVRQFILKFNGKKLAFNKIILGPQQVL